METQNNAFAPLQSNNFNQGSCSGVQPSGDLQSNIISALCHMTTNDNNVRQQSEKYLQEIQGTEGCLENLLMIMTNPEVSFCMLTFITVDRCPI